MVWSPEVSTWIDNSATADEDYRTSGLIPHSKREVCGVLDGLFMTAETVDIKIT